VASSGECRPVPAAMPSGKRRGATTATDSVALTREHGDWVSASDQVGAAGVNRGMGCRQRLYEPRSRWARNERMEVRVRKLTRRGFLRCAGQAGIAVGRRRADRMHVAVQHPLSRNRRRLKFQQGWQ